MPTVRVVPALLVVATVAMTAAHPGPAQAADAQVEVVNNEFRPREVTILAGEKVTWRFTGTAPHSVTADDRSFDSHPNCSPACSNAASPPFERTFPSAGTFRYFCKIHGARGGSGMSGTVVVRPVEEPPSPTTSPLPPEPGATTSAPPSQASTTTAPATTTTGAAGSATTAVPDTVAAAPAADPALETTTSLDAATTTTAATGETAAAAGDGSGSNIWPAALLALVCLAAAVGGLVRFRPR